MLNLQSKTREFLKMFHEIDPSLLKPSGDIYEKRWFRDAESQCDLFVWEDIEGTIDRYQFWYKEALIQWDKSGGIKTGRIDEKSGAFIHFQTDLYRIHSHIDEDILNSVQNLLHHQDTADLTVIEYVKKVLQDISSQSSG